MSDNLSNSVVKELNEIKLLLSGNESSQNESTARLYELKTVSIDEKTLEYLMKELTRLKSIL